MKAILKKIKKDDTGAASIIEMTLIFPLVLFVMGFLIYLGSYQDYFDYLTKQIRSINKSIANLREQRNKLLAHNGVEYNFDYKTINKKFPIVKSDVDKLMDYAFELTTFIIERFTGVVKLHTSIDIDDWNRTLELVREGQRAIRNEYEQLEEIF